MMKSSCSNTDTLKCLRLLWNTAVVTGNEATENKQLNKQSFYNIIKLIERGEILDSKLVQCICMIIIFRFYYHHHLIISNSIENSRGLYRSNRSLTFNQIIHCFHYSCIPTI